MGEGLIFSVRQGLQSLNLPLVGLGQWALAYVQQIHEAFDSLAPSCELAVFSRTCFKYLNICSI